MDLPKAYDPKLVEERLYRSWVEGGDFIPKMDPAKKPFVIIMPPPNVTGELHLGHALTATREDLPRQEMGRENFLERMGQWMNKYGRVIAEQHQRLGASCDWSRERFTLDPGPSRAVRTTFVNLYQKGLIYRGGRIINWCPRCQTALSDLERQHRELH